MNMNTEELIKNLRQLLPLGRSLYQGRLIGEAADRLEELQRKSDEARAEVERVKKCCEEGDKSYQREREAHAECRRDLAMALDKLENQSTEMTRPEPSRLEIAAMAMQGFITSSGFIMDIPKNSLEYADALIAAAKEAK